LACKIVLFNFRRLKLWKRVFDKVNFNTKQKQISLHRHFKVFAENQSLPRKSFKDTSRALFAGLKTLSKIMEKGLFEENQIKIGPALNEWLS